MTAIIYIWEGSIVMSKRIKLIIISVAVIAVAVISALLVYKFSPNKERKPLDECFDVSGDEMAILLQDEYSEEKGYCYDGVPYVKYSLVKERFNKRFYWEQNPGVMIYTTTDAVMKFTPDTAEYQSNKASKTMDYIPVRMINDQPYVAVPFVKEYSNITYSFYEKPNRVIINYKWDDNELTTTVKKKTVIRYEDNIKSPIIADVAQGDKLICVGMDEQIKNGFSKVITIDGVVGYISNKKIEESSYEKFVSDYTEPEYTHNLKDYNICLAWHQVTSQVANESVLKVLNETKGVNTISPTWFKITDNNGSVKSIASERYVERAHAAGVEVWGLCDDFSEEVDMTVLLGNMETREKLENKLLSLAIEFELDGINLDFEKIKQDGAESFIQFVREMSVKCKNNGIVLSIDNYVPVSYREYYNYEEQGKYADYIIIMAYDEHYSGSDEAGSVSSINYVDSACKNIVEKVDAKQVVMALPFYTRLWTVKNEGTDKQSLECATYSMENAEKLLGDRGLTPSWNDETAQYYAEYDEDGAKNKIWLEDEKSLGEKLKSITSNGLSNVAFWKLGLEKRAVWNEVSKYIK